MIQSWANAAGSASSSSSTCSAARASSSAQMSIGRSPDLRQATSSLSMVCHGFAAAASWRWASIASMRFCALVCTAGITLGRVARVGAIAYRIHCQSSPICPASAGHFFVVANWCYEQSRLCRCRELALGEHRVDAFLRVGLYCGDHVRPRSIPAACLWSVAFSATALVRQSRQCLIGRSFGS